jgi:hypothetical protein
VIRELLVTFDNPATSVAEWGTTKASIHSTMPELGDLHYRRSTTPNSLLVDFPLLEASTESTAGRQGIVRVLLSQEEVRGSNPLTST